eukprot:PITA_29936
MSHPTGLLQPLPIPEGKWDSISMDFITRLPMVQGKDCIFFVVDRLKKYAHFFAISAHYIVAQVPELFFREIFRLHGLLEPRFGSKRVRISSELSRITWLQRRTSRSCMPTGVGWRGSSRVIPRIGQVAYELELPQGSKIHNIFHVSCLNKALGQQVTTTDELTPMDDEDHLILQPEAIIDSRERRLWSRTVREFLVRWKNFPNHLGE